MLDYTPPPAIHEYRREDRPRDDLAILDHFHQHEDVPSDRAVAPFPSRLQLPSGGFLLLESDGYLLLESSSQQLDAGVA